MSINPKFNEKEVDFVNVKINDKKQLSFIVGRSKDLYFSNKKYDCVYSASPCIASMRVLENIKIIERFGYFVLQIKK